MMDKTELGEIETIIKDNIREIAGNSGDGYLNSYNDQFLKKSYIDIGNQKFLFFQNN